MLIYFKCYLLQRQFKSVTCYLFITLILNGTIRKKNYFEIYTEFMTSPGLWFKSNFDQYALDLVLHGQEIVLAGGK